MNLYLCAACHQIIRIDTCGMQAPTFQHDTPVKPVGQCCVCPAAASPEEFALLPRLLDWQQKGFLRLQLHTTQSHDLATYLQRNMQQHLQQQHPAAAHQEQPLLQQGRIDRAHLHQAVRELQQASQGLDAYVCGPPKMTDAIVEQLQQLGLDSSCIRTEKWW